MAKPKPRPKTRPHHTILHELVGNGVEVVDCGLVESEVPVIAAKYRGAIWWLVVHRIEPETVWTIDMIGHIATTVYPVAIVDSTKRAMDALTQKKELTRAQKYALGEILASGAETFTQKQIAEVLNAANQA